MEKLIGQFAFAVWDNQDRRLFLARDRFGQKPLIYARVGGRFYFASEAKSILCVLPMDPSISHQGVFNTLFFGGDQSSSTLFREIFRMPPAHYAWVDGDGRLSAHRYWNLDFSKKSGMRRDEAIERLHAVVQDAVRTQLVADVPLGFFLSGGVDSSMILYHAAQEMGEERLKTFCAVTSGLVDDPDIGASRIVARHFNAEHREINLDQTAEREAMLDYVRLIYHQEIPYYAGSNSLLHYELCRGVRRGGITTALSGDGGDEIFGGYPAYARIRRGGLLRAALGLPWVNFGVRKDRGTAFFFSDDANLLGTVYERAFGPTVGRLRKKLFKWIDIHEPRNLEVDTFRSVRPTSLLEGWMATELLLHNRHSITWQADVNGMAHGLEIRAPFLDHRVAEFMATLTDGDRVSLAGRCKILQRASLKGRVPQMVLDREKTGFGWKNANRVLHSWKRWVYGHLFPLGAPNLHLGEFFGTADLNDIWHEWESHPESMIHTGRIWQLFTFTIFCKLFLDRRTPEGLVEI